MPVPNSATQIIIDKTLRKSEGNKKCYDNERIRDNAALHCRPIYKINKILIFLVQHNNHAHAFSCSLLRSMFCIRIRN